MYVNKNFCSPSVSHTLPASGVHLRPALDSSAGHKSLKRYSSAGPDALHYPPPDYVELDNKAEVNSLSPTNAPGLSGTVCLLYSGVLVDWSKQNISF